MTSPRRSTGLVVLAILSLGCGGDTAAKTTGAQATEIRPGPAEADKRPRFECEFFLSHTVNGDTATSSGTTTRYEDGKPFSYVENHTSTIKGEGARSLLET